MREIAQSHYSVFKSNNQDQARKLRLDDAAIARLEKYARDNIPCIKCGKMIPEGDSFKIHVTPSASVGYLDVRVACFPCHGMEADGKTPLKGRLWFPVTERRGK